MAQIGAVLGRDFAYPLLRDLAESDLTQALRAVFGQPGFRKELEDMDGGAELIAEKWDISRADMEQFAGWVRAEVGVPDVVVNNAGIAIVGPFLAHTEDDWSRIVGVNLRMQAYVWGQDVLEFLATGTAIRCKSTAQASASLARVKAATKLSRSLPSTGRTP